MQNSCITRRRSWQRPELRPLGGVAEITRDIPPKVTGGSDGATWNQQQVWWGSK